MSRQASVKIKKAIVKGDLILHEKVFSKYSQKEREEILKKAKYIKAAMELRRLREVMNYSQEGLAKKMHVKREFISRVESGRQNVTLDTLYRIGEVLGKEVYIKFR